ncbi:MAG: methionyl-tRNA formyltransferase [Candidatus Omnitrophica bacterium]|nr:methionyl-tRNA formyltransferase [Candidatus Omnitrophota bacterium]
MKIIFFGSSHFAVPALEALIKSKQDICCVVTQPDQKKGRHLHLAGTDVKFVAQKADLEIFQPKDVNSAESVKQIIKFGADLFVVVAYGQILSQKVLDIPKILPINIHASLLPKYRGAAPVNWAIMQGDRTTGITIMQVTRKMDSGPIILQEAISIADNDDSVIIEEKLRKLGSELLIEALDEIKNKKYKLVAQDEEKVSYAPKLKKTDGYIDWCKNSVEIYNLIRGSLPWPGAFTYFKNKTLKIFKAKCMEGLSQQDSVSCSHVLAVNQDGILVVCGKGVLVIEELQLEGGKRMNAKDFVHGHKVKIGDCFGSYYKKAVE